MTQIIVAAVVAFAVSVFATPGLVIYFRRHGYGQEIRLEGPKSHMKKRGTPNMGGLAMLAAVWIGYIAAGLTGLVTVGGGGFTASGLLILFLGTALSAVGMVDDGLKVFKRQNKGLGMLSKTLGQLGAALIFGILALCFRNTEGLTPASTSLSTCATSSRSRSRSSSFCSSCSSSSTRGRTRSTSPTASTGSLRAPRRW